MRVLIVEPYFTGSHAAWANGYRHHSRHDVEILSLSGSNWKWRMHGGAVTLARRLGALGEGPDLVVATDMLDVTTFQSLTRTTTAQTPFVTYFHENQLSYPWSPDDRDVLNKRDRHYGFINYASALASDAVFFNSAYHMESFFEELVRLLRHFPDHQETGSIDVIREKSDVLPLGLDLKRFETGDVPPKGGTPLVLWNHRWEYDKNPGAFFEALDEMVRRGVDFRVAILGENFSQSPRDFGEARERLGDRIVQCGYAESVQDYAQWLKSSDVLPVTSNQDFFGTSIVEAVYCGCRPLLPRRLAYPEIIPEEHYAVVFYDDPDDLHDRLERALKEPKSITGLHDAVARFDWSVMAGVYDDVFDAVRKGETRA